MLVAHLFQPKNENSVVGKSKYSVLPCKYTIAGGRRISLLTAFQLGPCPDLKERRSIYAAEPVLMCKFGSFYLSLVTYKAGPIVLTSCLICDDSL